LPRRIMEPKEPTPIPDSERGPEGEDPARRRGQEPVSPNPLPDEGTPADDEEGEEEDEVGPIRKSAMESNRPSTNPDDERRPKDDKSAHRKSEEQEDLPQADGDSTDAGDASVEDAAKDAGLK
jgi:hypothetical protein